VKVILLPFGGIVAAFLLIGIVLLTVLTALYTARMATSPRS
jgi:hypothetical protein